MRRFKNNYGVSELLYDILAIAKYTIVMICNEVKDKNHLRVLFDIADKGNVVDHGILFKQMKRFW